MAKIYFFIIFIISIFVCSFAPQKYNYEYSFYCAIAYWFNVTTYLVVKKKKNYFDFDNLFFVAFFFVTLYYSSVMYESDPYRYVFYKLYFNKNQIPLASGIALLAINSYIFGAILIDEKTKNNFQKKNTKKINTTWLFAFSAILVILYIISGGYNNLINEYIGGVESVNDSGVSSYFFAFFPAFLLLGIIAEFSNLKIENPEKFVITKASKFGIAITGIIFLMFFLVGSRTIPLQIILVCVGMYTLLFKPIGLSKFTIYILSGFLVLSAIGYLRIALSNKNFSEKFHVEDSAMDLIINNRNSYILLDHVDKKGLSYGESMLSPILAPLPFAQSLVIDIFKLNPDNMRSALITTKDTFGKVGNWGLGTNIVADVYLAFGILGVIILFLVMGYYVNRFRVNSGQSTITLVCYAILLSYAVYLPRAEYFYFFRYFVWCIILLYITLRLQKIKTK